MVPDEHLELLALPFLGRVPLCEAEEREPMACTRATLDLSARHTRPVAHRVAVRMVAFLVWARLYNADAVGSPDALHSSSRITHQTVRSLVPTRTRAGAAAHHQTVRGRFPRYSGEVRIRITPVALYPAPFDLALPFSDVLGLHEGLLQGLEGHAMFAQDLLNNTRLALTVHRSHQPPPA